jgi:hypothetical protein
MDYMTNPVNTTLVVQATLEAFDCPRALAVWLLFRENEHNQLVNLECNPDNYLKAVDFRDAYQATKLLSKFTSLKLLTNKRDVALQKWKLAEDKCRLTNQSLSDPMFFFKHGVESILFRSIRKIQTILGKFDAKAWVDACDFGPGVTTVVKGCDTSHARKFQNESGASPRLITFIDSAWKDVYPNWPVQLKPEPSNKVITVPKNAKEDRTISVEPGINLWFQKGIGLLLRKRLLRVGLDLNEKTKLRKRNQHLAELASKTGELATVDFSSASDTISKQLVEILLPPDWYHAMVLSRSSHGLLENETYKYEKFSSMGNGFTFELETLIFYALSLSCCEAECESTENVSVYGDDVIIPVSVFKLFSKVSELCGFTVNLAKSYSQGMFRESCGDHWFGGIDCKPFYLREILKYDTDVYKVANGLRRLAHRRNSCGCDRAFLRPWRLLRKSVPANRRCLISEGYGDGGFIVNFDEACPSIVRARPSDGWEGFVCKHLAFKTRKVCHETHGLLLAKVRKGSPDGTSLGNDVPLRDRGRWVRKRLIVPRWYDLGPWI